MLFNLLTKIEKKIPIKRVAAHCDVPCGIYDPIGAQIAALTVVREVDQLIELNAKNNKSINDHANFARMVAIKEEHCRKVKEEICIIWGDFIKQPQLDAYPQLHDLTHQIMLAGSAAKQHVNRDNAINLLQKVNEFAEIFWAIKGVKTYLAKAPYPPELEVVYPDLKT